MQEKNKSNWKRRFSKQELKTCRKIKNKVIEKQTKKIGITTHEILRLMKDIPNFIGCYAEDEVSSLSITSFPAYLIVNVDGSKLPGSHWIGLMIDRTNVEVYDSSGFNLFLLPRVPCHLLSFIHRLTQSKRLAVTRQIQPLSSNLCGFYAMFFIICRHHYSLSDILSLFSPNLTKNDRRLINFL